MVIVINFDFLFDERMGYIIKYKKKRSCCRVKKELNFFKCIITFSL